MKIKYGLESLQSVLFVSALDFTNKLQLAQDLKGIKSVDISGDPTVLPLPNDAPLEIPRIMLKSTDQTYNVNAGPSRIDILFKNKDYDKDGISQSDPEAVTKQIIQTTLEINEVIVKKYRAEVNRLALIARVLIKFDISSKEYLQKKFIKKPVEQPFEINLAMLYRKDLKNFKVNKWKRFETLRNIKNPSDESAISLILDINTLPEINYKFTKDAINEFLMKASTEIDKDIKEDIDNV